MKKVLVISYYWPPAGGPGSQRVVKFAKYLPQFGWQPVVLTVKTGEFPYVDHSLEKDIPENVKVYRTKSWEPFLFYKKLTGRKHDEALPVGLLTNRKKGFAEGAASWIRANLFVPDARIGWIPLATKRALQIIRDEKIDLVFSSSPPHSLQLIGKKVKEKTGLPWVADFRDPWTDIRYYQYIKRIQWALKRDKLFEAQVLEFADAVIAVTQSFVDGFKQKISYEHGQKFFVLPNGYDDSDFKKISNAGAVAKFQIVHTGNLLEHQNPIPLWEGLRNLIEENPEMKRQISVRFVGSPHDAILKSAEQAGLNDLLQLKKFVPHSQAIEEIKNASILLLVVPQGERNRGIIPGKLFEYIGSGRPILAIAPQNSDVGKIIKSFSNSVACDFHESKKCAEFVLQIFQYWREGKLHESDPKLRSEYSRSNLAGKLAEILDSLRS